MKKLVLFAVLPLLIAAGCTTQYQAQAPYDDVYYSSRDMPAATAKVVVKQSQVPVTSDYNNANPQEKAQEANQQADNQPAYDTTVSYSEPGDATYNNSNYYDNYYDYAYASRLRRFHNNSYFNGYYDDYYTNMYWYDYNPWSWGTSIYFNSGWFGPSFGMNFGWGWPSYSYGWGGYSSFGYGGYWQGYYDGYYNGYYAGSYNNGWYNNEGGWYTNNNNHYYGHRGQSGFAGGSSNGRNSTGTTSQVQGRTIKSTSDLSTNNTNGRNTGIRLEKSSVINARTNNSNVSRDVTSANPRNTDASSVNSRVQQNPQGRTAQGNATSTSPRVYRGENQNMQSGRGRYIAPSQYRGRVAEPGRYTQGRQAAPQTRYANPQQQNNSRTNTNAQPRGNVYRDNTPRQAAQPARTYAQPGTRIQSYSSPSYSKPRSSQEYTTPKYRDMRNNGNYNQPQQRSGSNSNSNSNTRNNGQIRESTPRRSSNQSSSESQPSRSTYSAPSRSSDNSYSAPSRSSSSSSSGSSSGSSRSSSGSSDSHNGRR